MIATCFCMITAFAQKEVNGYWKGTITQEEGGFLPKYSIELFLIQKGDSIIGRSFVYVDSIFAEMDVTGQLHSGILLELRDTKVLEHESIQGMEWCIKRYQLLLKQQDSTLYLEGHWQGETSFSDCVPGKIFLKKKIPRA